jgi:hypothetical protein
MVMALGQTAAAARAAWRRTIGIIRRRGRPLRASAEHFQRLLLEYKQKTSARSGRKQGQRGALA